tara:strand:- start:5189 stop:6832 length:1644 start_codon:yes stop_codon:yes gene_type:complete
MKHALIGGAIVALVAGLAPFGTASAQHMPRLARSDADQAVAAIGLNRTNPERLSFERAEFRSGVYTFTNVIFHHTPEAEPGQDEEPELEEIHAARMIFDSPRLDADGNLLLHAFTLEDITSDDGDGAFRIERVSLAEPNPAMSADLGRILRGEGDAEEFDSRWEMYRFALLAMDNLALTGEEADGVFAIRLDRLAFIDYATDALGRFEFLGFSMDVEAEDGPVSVGLAEVSVDGLSTSSYSGLMEAAAAGADEAEMMAAYYATDFEDQMDLFDRALFRDFDMRMPGLAVTLDQIEMTMQERNALFESHVELGALRIVPDPTVAMGAEIAASLSLLGYESLEVSMEGNSVYDPQAGRAYTTGENYLELRDGLRLDLATDIGGYREYLANLRTLSAQAVLDAQAREDAGAKTGDESDAETEMAPDYMFDAMDPLTINRIALRLEDRSLLARGFAAGAAVQGLTPEEMRAQAGLMVAAGMMAAPPEIPRTLLSEVAAALTSFINQGGSLSIELAPPVPVTIGELKTQIEDDAIDFTSLGLQATAEPPAGD